MGSPTESQSSQVLSGAPRGSKVLPGAHRQTQELPGAPWGSPEGAPQDSWELSGAPQGSTGELPRTPRLPGAPWGFPGLPASPREPQGALGRRTWCDRPTGRRSLSAAASSCRTSSIICRTLHSVGKCRIAVISSTYLQLKEGKSKMM